MLIELINCGDHCLKAELNSSLQIVLIGPIIFSALHGCTGVVDVLLEKCNYAADMKDNCGTTPLMDAFRAGHLHVANLLIEKQKVLWNYPYVI